MKDEEKCTYEQELILKANEMLRSAYSIADREGNDTNWKAFKNKLKWVLDEQHRYLYPTKEEFRV